MAMILLDWTRMGRSYCLAGVVAEKGQYRLVRPLLARFRGSPVRTVGWSAYLMDGHRRWEIFELIGTEAAAVEPPHLEDRWVKALQSRGRSAPAAQRREILAATRSDTAEGLFGGPLLSTRTAAYLNAGTGCRSLASLVIPAGQLAFQVSWREGHGEPDFRVTLPLPEVGTRSLPLKDHHLLNAAEEATHDLQEQVEQIRRAVAQMGEQVAVRVGLSRPFQAEPGESGRCWLMADGLFSFADPQP